MSLFPVSDVGCFLFFPAPINLTKLHRLLASPPLRLLPNSAQVETFAGSFLASTPRLDVLVNNAGGMPATRTRSAQGREAIMVHTLYAKPLLKCQVVRCTYFFFFIFFFTSTCAFTSS